MSLRYNFQSAFVTPDTLLIQNMKSTVVVSVYRDVRSLRCILLALKAQSTNDFEVIVSEDGESSEMRKYLETQEAFPAARLVHLTQQDRGFRKNKALNQAIRKATSGHLIFIDGDCVPAVDFVKSHQTASSNRFVTAGRRLELGPIVSEKLRENPKIVENLSRFTGFCRWIPRILLDKGKNIESGLRIPFLDMFRSNQSINLVGCNFSCPKKFLEEINGFNEEYESPGLGEDTDIDWRLKAQNRITVSVKFRATLFHLYHPRIYTVSNVNFEIFSRSKRDGQVVTRNGLER